MSKKFVTLISVLLLVALLAGCGSEAAPAAPAAEESQAVEETAAPLGDPIEVNVRGYELSIRKADAEMIEIE